MTTPKTTPRKRRAHEEEHGYAANIPTKDVQLDDVLKPVNMAPTATTARKYRCPVCEPYFMKPSFGSIVTHINKEHYKKEYQCDTCDFKSFSYDAFSHHMCY
jgi:uncharacterized protein with PIN domain